MRSRNLILLLAGVTVALITLFVSWRFGVVFFLLPLFFVWSWGGDRDGNAQRGSQGRRGDLANEDATAERSGDRPDERVKDGRGDEDERGLDGEGI